MESAVELQSKTKRTWLIKQCRQFVFNALDTLTTAQIDITEGNEIFSFGHITNKASINDQTLQGKIVISDISAYVDFIRGGSIGVAEAYIEQKWHSPDLTTVIQIFAQAQQVTDNIDQQKSLWSSLKSKIFHLLNNNTQSGSKKNIVAHYDLGNALYSRFLDSTMMYSSAIYPTEKATLAQAQNHKLALICQKLDLKPDEHVIEIGTGWGSLAIYMAKNYGCNVTTTTISEEQFAYATQAVKAHGLEDKITLLKDDYRHLTGQFDKLVSIEMIEAVGYKFMPSFFQTCNRLLKPDGKMLIQAITIKDQRLKYYLKNVDFIQRYIFPGGFLPSINLLNEQLSKQTTMVMESLDDIGLDYAKTLADWRNNFLNNWHEIKQHGYDESFKRLWLYYFAYCEGAFLARATSTVQFTARK